ncbi:MAG: hypothetical protein GX804_09505 [Lentisphaerae bacterium]|jgi:hypothetical protein|nr:hypothetical protein [Lentisphaerota bacterium]
MTQEKITDACNGTICVPAPEGTSITAAYTSDMLSDVMAHAPENSVLITIQNHINTVAVCTLVGAKIIILCHDRNVPDDMSSVSAEEGIGIITTPLSQFEASCAVGKILQNT